MAKIVALAILAFGLLLIGRSAAHAQPITGAYCLLTFTALTPGCVPPSGGGTTNFLRADGNWAPPPGTGGTGNLGSPGPIGNITPSTGQFTTLTLNPAANSPGLTTAGSPSAAAPSNDLYQVDLTNNTSNVALNPGFTDTNTLQITENFQHGDNVYGGGTNAKSTPINLLLTGNQTGAGEKFLMGLKQNCYGMGDCFAGSDTVQFAGGDISGDEGTGFRSVSNLEQQGSLVLTTITAAPVRTACNTTATQAITASASPQTVSVASTAGCNVGDWVVVNEQSPTSSPNNEAVQITAVGTGTITGVFRTNQSSGVTITPAVLLTLGSTSQFGQQRVLVDLTRTPYTTGTASGSPGSSGTFTGVGTSWSTSMVGGTATNIGCIELAADQYTGAPFNGANGPLNAWYQISAVSSGTSLAIYKTSTAGDAAYEGKGSTAGSYAIRPCAEVLRVIDNTHVVLETSSMAWTNGDSVELAISPYPDVTGFQDYVTAYTAGGTYREAQLYRNTGSRTFTEAVRIDSSMPSGGGADTVAWGNGIEMSGIGVGLSIDNPTQAALVMPQSTTSAIEWGSLQNGAPVNQYLGYTSANGGGLLVHGINGTGGAIDKGAITITESTYPNPWMNFVGMLGLSAISNNNTGTRVRFHSDSGDAQTATSFIDLKYPYPYTTITLNGTTYQVATPAAPTLSTQTTGGNGSLAASTTYYVVLTGISANGETVQSSAASVATGAGTTNQITVTLPSLANGETGFNVYAGTSSSGPFYQQNTGGSATGSFIFGTASNPFQTSGTQPPSSSTANIDLVKFDLGNAKVTVNGTINYVTLPTGTPSTYACFDSSGNLISSATAC